MKNQNEHVLDTLIFILEKIKDEKLSWFLTGSANLLVQGIDIIAKDIDIITTKEDAFKFYNLFLEYGIQEVKYSSTDKFRSYFGKLNIKGIHKWNHGIK